MSTTLYVSNLPFSATEEMLAGKFGKFGPIVAVRLDPATRGRARSGFVEMKDAAHAQTAIDTLNFSSIDGRLMSVFRATAAAPALK